MQGCQVCSNPRKPDLSTSEIEWHNLGHPGLADVRPIDSKKLRTMVIIRPGDQILYEVSPGKWCRIDELDVAIAAGQRIKGRIINCSRCSRRVFDRRPSASGLIRSLLERVIPAGLRKSG